MSVSLCLRLTPLAALLLASAGCDSSGVAGPVTDKAVVQTSASEPTVSKDDLVDRTFDDIKFGIEPDAPYDESMLTDAIRRLNGQRIRLRGYILPTAQSRGIKQFVLVRDNQECCFGPGAALYDCVLVEMQEGATAEFSIRPVAVEGRFGIDEFVGPGGRTLAIYRIDGESVD